MCYILYSLKVGENWWVISIVVHSGPDSETWLSRLSWTYFPLCDLRLTPQQVFHLTVISPCGDAPSRAGSLIMWWLYMHCGVLFSQEKNSATHAREYTYVHVCPHTNTHIHTASPLRSCDIFHPPAWWPDSAPQSAASPYHQPHHCPLFTTRTDPQMLKTASTQPWQKNRLCWRLMSTSEYSYKYS